MQYTNLLIILVSNLFWGCLFDYSRDSKSSQPPQLELAMCYDRSLSAQTYQIPELTPYLVDNFLSTVRARTGEFAFSCIEEQRPHMVRLRFENETGTGPEAQRRREMNDRQLARVRQSVYESIKARKAKFSRVYDSVELMLTYLQEPHLPADAQRLLVVISDFQDDMRPHGQRQPISIPANVTVIAVGAEPLSVEQVLTGPGKVVCYTTLHGLIDYITMEPEA